MEIRIFAAALIFLCGIRCTAQNAVPFAVPEARLETGHLVLTSPDSSLTELECIRLFWHGKEYTAETADLRRHTSIDRLWEDIDEGTITRRILLKNVQLFPLSMFERRDGKGGEHYLPQTALPDSLYIVGKLEEGCWFFERMERREDRSFGRTSYYMESPDGSIWCAPLDQPPPWKVLRTTDRDL